MEDASSHYPKVDDDLGSLVFSNQASKIVVHLQRKNLKILVEEQRRFQEGGFKKRHDEMGSHQSGFKKLHDDTGSRHSRKGSQQRGGSTSSGSTSSSYSATLRELDITPGSYKEVEVVYFLNLNEFYVQPVDFASDLSTMMEQIRRTYTGGKRAKHYLNKGDACAALYASDNVWYRAKVEAVRGPNVSVYFVDYGNKEDVRSDGVQTLKTEFLALPMLAIRCSVEDPTIRQDEFVESVMDKRLLANFLNRDRHGGWTVKLLDPNKTVLSKSSKVVDLCFCRVIQDGC